MNRFTMTRAALAVASALLVATGAQAQTAAPSAAGATASAPAQRLARGDVDFLKQAAQNGHAEVESGKLAETKASSDKVKEFAKQMIADHTKANEELAALATAKGVDVPKEPSVAQKGKMKVLGMAEGAKFDAKYADEMGVKAHQDTIKLFEKAASGAKDPEVKAFATKTLPTLKQHLEHARSLKSSVGKG